MDSNALAERLAQEIRRVDGSHSMGAAALAEALVPFVESALRAGAEPVAWLCDAGDGENVNATARLDTRDDYARFGRKIIPLYTRPQPAALASGWMPISEATNLPRDMTGVSGPCAVLLTIDTSRGGAFIRQGRFDIAAGGFVCDTTGQVLRDAIAFAKPDWTFLPAATPTHEQPGADR